MSARLCQHCGLQHADHGECPRTGLSMDAPGPCGNRLDRYDVERLLGEGGFGSVYLAHHARTRQKVALKVLKRELMTNQPLLERFMREASTAAQVSNEHIVQVIDAEIIQGGVAFIALELLEGDDLKGLAIRERPLHPARIIGLILQVLDGLAAAHAAGIVHRDMKPGNVFITRRPGPVPGEEVEHAKVLDFGISKVVGATALTLAGAALGTPAYMSWEQFFDAHGVDARTDLYAVAVMLYELLAGKKPFDADSFPALMHKVRIGESQPLRKAAPSLPVPLVAVVEKGLAKDRERRWQTAQDFSRALSNALELMEPAPPLSPRTAVMKALPKADEDPEFDVATVHRQKPAPVKPQDPDETVKTLGGMKKP